jgi:hypothetical protein
MVLALLTTSFLSIVCFIMTAYLGIAHGRADVSTHFLWGFFTTFLVTLSQSMTMFYFIGTGKQVKDLVVNDSMAQDFIQRTKRFKARVFPPSLWAILFTMAAMIIGGGVHTRMIPTFVHTILAVCALYFNLIAFWREAKYMIEHNMLMVELEKRLDQASIPIPDVEIQPSPQAK